MPGRLRAHPAAQFVISACAKMTRREHAKMTNQGLDGLAFFADQRKRW